MRVGPKVVLCALAAVGCGPALPEARPTHAPVASPSRANERRATLHYELRGRSFPLPVVRGTVNGIATWMLVDTGANTHVIAGWFARKLALVTGREAAPGTDHLGKPISTYRLGEPKVAIDGWGAVPARELVGADVPDAIERLGIGVFLSPQHLAEHAGDIILDLAGASMTAARVPNAQGAEQAQLVAAGHGSVCDDGFPEGGRRTFVVPATMNGHDAALLLDTGAEHSDVFASSKAGRVLRALSAKAHDATYTASGATARRTVRGVRLVAGSVHARVDVDVVDGASDALCRRDGVLAMDVLRSCVLVFSGARVSGTCRATP